MSWELSRLADVATVVRGVTYKRAEARGTSAEGHLPLLRATNIGATLDTVNNLVYVPEARVSSTQRIRVGDIVLASSSGSLSVVGKSAQLRSPWEGTFGAFCAAIRPESVDPTFLGHYLSSARIRREWSRAAKGTNINNLKLSTVAETRVPVPTMNEQMRIVEFLEDHLTRLDAAAKEVAYARMRLDALLLATLRVHVAEMKEGATDFERIGNLAATSLGKMLDAKKTTGEPTLYLANINVRWGQFELGHLKSVPLTAVEQARLTMAPGDVIVCEGGEPGRCAVWDRENSGIAYQKALHRVRVHDSSRMAPEYLALMLREAIQSGRADRLFTGTTIKHLPQEKLRMIEIPVPDMSVQLMTLGQVDAVSQASERLEAVLGAASTRGNALRSAVLASAFDGKLTGRHTDTEVIEELAYA